MTEGIRWYREWDLVLIGCGKAKQPEASPAIDLYTGPVFGAHLAIAEHLDAFPMVLSAKHGIVERNVEVEPYELAVGDLRGADLERWNEAVFRYVHSVLSQAADPRRISVPRDPAYDRPIKERRRHFSPEVWAFGPPRQPTVLVLAGAPYIDGWAPRIRALGYQVDDPLRGFTLGQRRAFARHFVSTTPAWKPGDRPLDLAEDAWLWPDVAWQPCSRREQLLGEARDFLDDPLPDLTADTAPSGAGLARPARPGFPDGGDMRTMTEAKRSLLLALIADGATGILINSAGVWRATGDDPSGQAAVGYCTEQTWATATVTSLWADDLLLDNGSRGSMQISAAGRERALKLRRAASSAATSSPGAGA